MGGVLIRLERPSRTIRRLGFGLALYGVYLANLGVIV